MAVVKKARMEDMVSKLQNEHDPYVYTQRVFVPKREGGQCAVSVYTIPPPEICVPISLSYEKRRGFLYSQGKRAASHTPGGRTCNGGGFSLFPCGGKGSPVSSPIYPKRNLFSILISIPATI